jgi:hypothetical protein
LCDRINRFLIKARARKGNESGGGVGHID